MTIQPFGNYFWEVLSRELASVAECQESDLGNLPFELGELLDACRKLVHDIERFHEEIRLKAPLPDLYASATRISFESGEHIPSHGRNTSRILEHVRDHLKAACLARGMSEDEFYDEHKRIVERRVEERSSEPQ